MVPCVIDMKTRDSLIIKKQHLSNNYHSEKRNKIASKRRQDFDSKSNAENPQRSIIQHTSTIVSQQKVESNKNCTIGSYKIKETQNESIDAAQKTAVINTTPVVHNEREIIRRAQNDINLRGSELPVLSVKSTVAIDAGAAKVQAGVARVAGTVNADADAANVVNPRNTLLYITIDPLSTSIQPPDQLSAPSIHVTDYFKSPPISLSDFVTGKDPTNIVMLCIDLGMPLLVLEGEHLLVTDHSIHCNQPSYWTIEPNFKCQRIIFDENEKRGVDKSTSDINKTPTLKVKSFAKADAENALDKINGLRVPEDVYLENKSYKKLSHVPLVYAQVSCGRAGRCCAWWRTWRRRSG
ncbi:uncharacterized protein LOC113227702 isoform X2 [Hyposmocoma kahamanoa]|uniref:uncharacterized protein LOC113227702 isoform X2 n=1 Tax=Hyposmocoma kahamanoa TaxID=1477025 RepID=UPI000E6D611D|nr:uncharacterized protein LOC113227702 isoform X2 [Hyposmocoma kahamanoa]